MASSHKKVIVRKMGRDSIGGYVSPANFVAEGKLELLNPSGKVVLIDLGEVKSVDFVRDFSDTAAVGRKTFTSRPRTDGLWVRLKFTDNDVLEGLMANDLTQIGAGRIFHYAAGYARQHATGLRPPDSIAGIECAGGDRASRSPQENGGRRSPGKVVYGVLRIGSLRFCSVLFRSSRYNHAFRQVFLRTHWL